MPHKDPEEFFDPELLQSVARFEEMLRKKDKYFFDFPDFENLIEYYYQKEEFNSALKVVDIAIEQHPYNIEFLLNKADILIILEKYDFALELLEKVEHLGSSNAELYIFRGDVAVLLNNFNEALTHFKKGLEITDDLEDAEEIHQKLAFTYECLGRYSDAVEQLKKCLVIDPENEDVLYELSMCCKISENFEEGIKSFNAVIDAQPYNHLAWFYLGNCYYQSGLYEHAKSAYEYSILINEEFEAGYERFGITLALLSSYEESNSMLKNLLDINPEHAVALKHIGKNYTSLERYSTARNYFEKASRFSKSKIEKLELAYLTGRSFELEEKWMQARNYYRKATNSPDANSSYFEALGYIEVQLNNIPKAILAFKQAITIDPDNAQHWISLSFCYYSEGNLEYSIEVLSDANDYIVSDSSLKYILFWYFYRLGKIKESLIYLEDALDLNREGYKTLIEMFPEATFDGDVLNMIKQYKTEI